MEKPVKEYKITLKKNRYLIPAVSMLIYLSITVLIVTLMTYAIPTKKAVTIATNTAEEAFYNKKYDVAIEGYKKLQEKDEWPIWNVKIAEIYSIKGDFVKSNDLLQKSYEARNKVVDTQGKEKIEDKDKELTNYIVFTYLMNGENKKALEYGELFLKDYPTDKNLLKTMFTVYLVNNEKTKAKELVKNYPRQDLTSSDLAILAEMNMLVDNWNEGFSLLKDAWYLDKNEVKVFDVVAQIAADDKEGTLSKISKLQKDNPNEVAYKLMMAKIYSMSKDSANKAKEIIDSLGSNDTDSVNLMLIESSIYKNMGDTEKSEEILNQIINNNSDSFIGYNIAAWKSCDLGKYADATEYCKKSILANRDYADNYASLMVEIMSKQGKMEGTEPYFRTALYKEPFNYSIMTKLAEYYSNTVKDTDKALYYYNLASKINPNDAEIYYDMALINISNQREDEAIELLKKSIKLNEKSSKYYRALGTTYLNKQKNEDAIKAIRNSYSIDKNDILTLNNAGCYYITVEKDVSKAMTNLKAAYDGINEKTDENDKKIITDNYNKVKALYDSYNKNKDIKLQVPDLKLFY